MAMATHLILLMCQYFLRALPAKHGVMVSNTKFLQVTSPGFGDFSIVSKQDFAVFALSRS